MATGIFSLGTVYFRQIENKVNNEYSSWPENNSYGYLYSTVDISKLYKFDFTSESFLATTTNLPTLATWIGTTSNNSYGYFGGGYNFQTVPGIFYSNIDRLDFSTESLTTLSSKLSISRSDTYGVSNDSYGYFGGGYFIPPLTANTRSTIDRLDFSNETITVPSSKLITGRNCHSTFQNKEYYGYFGGGYAGKAMISSIERFDFSSELLSSNGNISIARGFMNNVYNELNAYIGGGQDFIVQPTIGFSTVERLNFSSNTITTIQSFPKLESIASSSLQNNYYGYAMSFIDIHRIEFSTETIKTSSSLISTQNYGGNISLNFPKFNFEKLNKSIGYFAGGFNFPSGSYSYVNKLNFFTESSNTIGQFLPSSVNSMGSVSSNFYGYFCGGSIPVSPSISSKITRIDFSNETYTNPEKNLPTGLREMAAISSNSYGYLGGGFAPILGGLSSITRIDFSNETVSNPSKNFTSTVYGITAFSSNLYGYFGGGFTPFTRNTINRFDFSTEIIQNSTNNLPSARSYMGANSSNSYGYFAGSSNYISLITRLDFNSEVVSNLSTTLPQGISNLAGTSSNFNGYFGGGWLPGAISSISRLNFLTETVDLPLTRNLPISLGYMSAISNSN